MARRLKKKRTISITKLFDLLDGEWIPLDLPELVEIHIAAGEEIDSELIVSKVVKLVISVDDGDEIDREALEQFMQLHTLSFQISIVRVKSRKTRIREKLLSKSPEDAIRAYMTQMPPLDAEATLTAAINCLDAD